MKLSVSFVALLAVVQLAVAVPFHGKHCKRGEVLPSYDYVIVGGGAAGLVVANRLSENPRVTVLVVEAGPLLSAEQEFKDILIPAMNVPNQGKIPYWWPVNVIPDTELNNRATVARAGKIVGGGTAVNAMVFDVGSKRDYEDWKEFTGYTEWGWTGIQPYLKKIETFTPPNQSMRNEFGISWTNSVHGFTGPISATYPPVAYPHQKHWVAGEASIGVPRPVDGASGNKVGSLYVPYAIRPNEWIRSYGKNEYYDPVKTRPNLHLITDNTVTKIKFEGTKAVGIEYSTAPEVPVKFMKANREVILAAGALHTPRLLQVSGVGPKAVLTKHNIKPVSILPGVGENLQDNPNVSVDYAINWAVNPTSFVANQTFQDEEMVKYLANRSGWLTVPAEIHINYLNLKLLNPANWGSILASATIPDVTKYLRAGLDATVKAGYKKQRALTLKAIVQDTPAAEFVRLRAVVSRPLSRGYVEISSADPWAKVNLDWRTLTDPFDQKIIVEGVKFLRKLLKTGPIQAALSPITEKAPGADKTTDAAILEWVRGAATATYFHLMSTCQLGPKELGGVVDRKLKVYGTQKLRIVDASIFPLNIAAHTSHTVYAVAEKAADIIKADYA